MRRVATILSLAGFSTCVYAQYTVEILHEVRWPQSACFGAAKGRQAGTVGNLWFRAILWNGDGTFVDLHDPTWRNSGAAATDGLRQVGSKSTPQTYIRATMWSGSSTSWVDLHPAGYVLSAATGIAGDSQVGWAKPNPQSHVNHAILWHNTAQSAISLHPSRANSSEALATDGVQHVGFVNTFAAQEHAALWQGNPPRHVDLHPDGYHLSIARGVGGGQQVGTAAYHGNGHAALWHGSRETFVDLNPTFGRLNWGSRANATNGSIQVGMAGSYFPVVIHVHAALWRGSSDSYMNLHQFLPDAYQGYLVGAESEAMAIDEDGVIAGWARHLPTNTQHAVLWRPVKN